MALTTTGRLAEALGKSLDPDEEEQAQYFIDVVSAYIVAYTGTDFSPPESGGRTERLQADYYGVIDLPGPVSDVATVIRWRSGFEHQTWQWNGLNRVYGLGANEVVDVTYTGGFDSIPEEIELVATEASKRLFESPSGQETGPLTRYRVGDVEESYRAVDVGSLGGLFNDLEKLILNEYRTTQTTYRAGFSLPDNITNIPNNENALFE